MDVIRAYNYENISSPVSAPDWRKAVMITLVFMGNTYLFHAMKICHYQNKVQLYCISTLPNIFPSCMDTKSVVELVFSLIGEFLSNQCNNSTVITIHKYQRTIKVIDFMHSAENTLNAK